MQELAPVMWLIDTACSLAVRLFFSVHLIRHNVMNNEKGKKIKKNSKLERTNKENVILMERKMRNCKR